MTAEIAILNKSAVSLATDSAVTISTGAKEQKIYDSADKLFELCQSNPIGIMIYNGMQFSQIPLQTLICEFRSRSKSYNRVEDAVDDFLLFLNEWGKKSPASVQQHSLRIILNPVLSAISNRISTKLNDAITQLSKENRLHEIDIAEMHNEIVTDTIAVFLRAVNSAENSQFVGGAPRITAQRRREIGRVVNEQFPHFAEDSNHYAELLKVCVLVVLRYMGPSPSHTGVVIAGFGSDDLFPTLVSFEVDGMVFGRLKFKTTNKVDIDRNGERARVIPFAQKEMVERFLYGLDEDIERNIALFCKETVPEIRRQIVEHLDISEADRLNIEQRSQVAEDAFVNELRSKEFGTIRSQSQKEIEDMVEFMPKPELATMAEALVNLTSIKRRVSRGFETVGGPIDVAVISRTEGFIWVKRKHYFSPDLNPRYVKRVKIERELIKEAGGDE